MRRRKLGYREYSRYRLDARKRGEEIYENGDVRAEFRAAMYTADKVEARRRKIAAVMTGGLGLLLVGGLAGLGTII